MVDRESILDVELRSNAGYDLDAATSGGRGLPLGYTVVPANEKEYEPLADLLSGTAAEVVLADKGFWGRGYRERLAADGTTLLTPAPTRTKVGAARARFRAFAALLLPDNFARGGCRP